MSGFFGELGEMSLPNRQMPSALQQLSSLQYAYSEGEGIDFEPFPEFLPAAETTAWIHTWTGNTTLDGKEYLIFGADGSGGYAALWCVRKSLPLTDQPIVFFGSEGEVGVVARNLDEYMWLLANNVGPFEAVSYPATETVPNAIFTTFAEAHSGGPKMTAAEVLQLAQSEFPDFKEQFLAKVTF